MKAAGSGQIWCIFELELSEFAREYMWSVREREASRMTAGFFIRATGKMELTFIEIEKWKLESRCGTREAFAFKVGGGAA